MAGKPKKTSCRPQLELLEDRWTPSVSVLGGFDALSYTGYNPPNTMVAVGPAYLVETVNSTLAVYDKATGALASQQTLSTLFSGFDNAGMGMFDPSVLYDDQAGRFVISAQVQDTASSKAYVDMAVSDSADPTHGFSEIHQIEVDEGGIYWCDNGKLGFNADAYVFTGNAYPFGMGPGHEIVLTLNKTSVLDQNNSTFTDYQVDVPDAFSLIPARMHGSAVGGPMWFVETAPGGGSSVTVTRMDNVLSPTPTFTTFNLPVDAYVLPTAGVQPGGTVTAFDCRTLSVEWNNNNLVAAFNTSVGADDAAAWLELSTSGSAPVVVQDGVVHPGSGISTYFPAVAVDSSGNMGMTYVEFSATEYASTYVTGRSASDPLGTMQTPVCVAAGTTTSQSRYGDNSGISLDPSTPNVFWAGNEYTSGPGWRTWIARFQLISNGSGVNQPPSVAVAASASPNPVTGTTTNLSVLGADDTGESRLTYTWSLQSGPTGAPNPSFSANGTNAAKNTTATFYQAGAYIFQVIITDPSGLTATSSVSVTVNQTATTLTMSPGSVTLSDGAAQQFTATALDQFGKVLVSQPAIAWSFTGLGSLSGTGMYSAPSSGTGSATIHASCGSLSATAAVTITSPKVTIPAAPTFTASTALASQIILNWTESSTNVSGFIIQRSTNGGKTWTQVAQVSGSVFTWTDTTVRKGKTYQYRIAAVNSAGTSAWSTAITLTTPMV